MNDHQHPVSQLAGQGIGGTILDYLKGEGLKVESGRADQINVAYDARLDS